MNAPSQPLSARQNASFLALVALAAIFIDAAIGHGLTWENDPYWTYWITKTFLIATVFGLGTAVLGIGEIQGAIITVVHTIILTVYYWTLSPIGFPSTPVWLDFEHTWLTGLPIHFAVIYAGYLIALWIWRRTTRELIAAESRGVAMRALIFGLGITVVGGGLASLAMGEFPGVTWFVVRILITVSFLLVWWGVFRADTESGAVGAILLALGWAAYGQFLGPSGYPDRPLRLFDVAPPPVTAEWLTYRDLWLVSLPIYLAVMLGAMALAERPALDAVRRPLALAVLVPLALLVAALAFVSDDKGVSATFAASGPVTGEGISDGTGEVAITVMDTGNRVSPLPPHDEIDLTANIDAGGQTYLITVRKPMIEDPTGRETTWWGVGMDVDYREEDGGNVRADLIAYGFGDLTIDGELVAAGLPVEVLASHDSDYGLELELGADVAAVPGQAEGALSVEWETFAGNAPHGDRNARYGIGAVTILVVLAALLSLNRRERILLAS